MKTLIVGVGGAGTNLIKTVQQLPGRALLAVNTDAASLARSGLANTLLIGKDICGGQSTDGTVELGKLAAETALTELKSAMESYQQLAVVTGFGGGTGTGAAPVVAELGHGLGLRVILVAVLPFAFETTRFDLTQSVLKALEGSPFRILTFKNDDAITDDQPLSMKEALALMNKQVASGLGVALQLTTEMRAAVPSQSSSKPVMPPIRYNQTEKMTLRFNFCKTQINTFNAFEHGLLNSVIHWIPDNMAELLSEEEAVKEKHRQIVLDTETTGLDPNHDRIIEIGCVELIDGKPSGRRHHWYLNPEQQISEAAFSVHGISNETLADEPTFVEIIDDLLGFIREAELVIHNASFDLGFLNAELVRSGHSKRFDTRRNVTDTLALARRLHPGQKNDLDSLCQRYGVDNSQRDLHGALLDAELLAEVYQGLLITDAKKR